MDEAPGTKPPDKEAGTTLFAFDGRGPAWRAVNDDVMGGVSSSMVSTDSETQRLVFSGNLSLENNGGFASARTDWSEYDLTHYEGIILRVRGDGRAYQFRVYAEREGARITYTALFETEPEAWQDIYIPFAEMTPIHRGVALRQTPALDPGAIRSFGFMLAGKQAGEFFLEVEKLTAVVAGNRQAEASRIGERD